ncbi:MAG TPA: DUF2637 domain-containing protein [Streptosporangiaceae bacterium]
MTDYPVARGSRAADPQPRLRATALAAVIIGVLLVAAAAFLLSYQGIHQIALHAGVSPELARLYPVIFDAMLVMACSAALALRGAGWWTRCYVWACLLLLLAAVAAGDAVYAMSISLPRQAARAVVAVLPWVLLLMGFGLLLCMLRYWRRARSASGTGAEAGAASAADSTAGAAAGATAVTWAGAGAGAAKPGSPKAGIADLLEPRPGQPPDRAALAAGGAAGTRAAIATAEPAEGEHLDWDDAGSRRYDAGWQEAEGGAPAGTGTDDDLPPGPAVTYEAEPAAPGEPGAPPAEPGAAGPEPASTAGPPGPPSVPAPSTPHFDRILSSPTHPQEPETDVE